MLMIMIVNIKSAYLILTTTLWGGYTIITCNLQIKELRCKKGKQITQCNK